MPWPNLFWLIIGLDCQWVSGSGASGVGPYVVLSDAAVIPLLVVTLVGCITVLRGLVRLGRRLIRPRALSRDARILADFHQQAQQAADDYLRPYR
jgi:hypothetical protein